MQKKSNKIRKTMLKDQLTSECAGLILGEVRKDHRLTMISDECGINRKCLNRSSFRQLRFHRLVRLLYATSSWMNREDFQALGAKLFGNIWDFCAEHDEEFYSK